MWFSLASETSPHQNQINALPAPPLIHNPSSEDKLKTVQSLEPDYFLPQLNPNTVESGKETESLIASESPLLGLYDESNDDSYDDSYDAPVASVTSSSVVPQDALDQLLAPLPPRENPKFHKGENPHQNSLQNIDNLKTKDATEEIEKTLLKLGRDVYSWNVFMFDNISDLSIMFIYFLLADGKSADVRIKPSHLDSLLWKLK